MTTPLTAGELTQGIANAIRAHDFPAAADMLRALAVIDPTAAQAVYEIFEAVIATVPLRAVPAEAADALTEAMP